MPCGDRELRTYFSWQNVIAEHEIRNISCAAQDPEDLCTFAYITKDLQTGHHYCHVFSTVDVVSVPMTTAGSALRRQQCPWPSRGRSPCGWMGEVSAGLSPDRQWSGLRMKPAGSIQCSPFHSHEHPEGSALGLGISDTLVCSYLFLDETGCHPSAPALQAAGSRTLLAPAYPTGSALRPALWGFLHTDAAGSLCSPGPWHQMPSFTPGSSMMEKSCLLPSGLHSITWH